MLNYSDCCIRTENVFPFLLLMFFTTTNVLRSIHQNWVEILSGTPMCEWRKEDAPEWNWKLFSSRQKCVRRSLENFWNAVEVFLKRGWSVYSNGSSTSMEIQNYVNVCYYYYCWQLLHSNICPNMYNESLTMITQQISVKILLLKLNS